MKFSWNFNYDGKGIHEMCWLGHALFRFTGEIQQQSFQCTNQLENKSGLFFGQLYVNQKLLFLLNISGEPVLT